MKRVCSTVDLHMTCVTLKFIYFKFILYLEAASPNMDFWNKVNWTQEYPNTCAWRLHHWTARWTMRQKYPLHILWLKMSENAVNTEWDVATGCTCVFTIITYFVNMKCWSEFYWGYFHASVNRRIDLWHPCYWLLKIRTFCNPLTDSDKLLYVYTVGCWHCTSSMRKLL
jgi:hypothetical protein